MSAAGILPRCHRTGPGRIGVVTLRTPTTTVRSSRTSVSNRPYLSASTPVRVGDTLTLTAPTVLGYGFGDWRLQPADGTAEGCA